jgi:hypothetical protein
VELVLFNHQPIEVPEQLNKELVERFRLANRLQAYWDNGEVDKINCLANILKNDSNLLTATLTSLTHFRSVASFERLKQFAQRGDLQLKADIQLRYSVMRCMSGFMLPKASLISFQLANETMLTLPLG